MTLNNDKRNIQKNYPQKKRKKTNNHTDEEIVDSTSFTSINNISKEIKSPCTCQGFVSSKSHDNYCLIDKKKM